MKQIEIKGDIKDKQEESYKNKRRNYAKANYTAMKKFFNETNRTKMKKLKDVQEKYDLFLMINFQKVFATESDFKKPRGQVRKK